VGEEGSDESVWRIRTNQELKELYKTLDLAADVNRRRFEWLGHVTGMDQTRADKNR
jgi:hypothetical protein